MNDTPENQTFEAQDGHENRLASLLLIAGPTASGKSGLAIAAAKTIKECGKQPVIINADASQVYADLDIVSARPSTAEMEDIPHRLFGYRDGATACSAADWAKDAKQQIKTAIAAGSYPILVGGTGLYISTLLDGIAPIPDIDPDLRARIRQMEQTRAYAQLQETDPSIATKLNPNDKSRVQRALEVVLQTGQSIAIWRNKREGGIAKHINLHPHILLPEREWLYARCNQRFVEMLDQGAIREVETLLSRDLPMDLPVMRAIGVAEISSFLRGQCSYDEMVEAGQMATRRYAKRQYTWLRNQPPQDWPRLSPDSQQMEPKGLFANWLDS